jgi:hypothetical protein
VSSRTLSRAYGTHVSARTSRFAFGRRGASASANTSNLINLHRRCSRHNHEEAILHPVVDRAELHDRRYHLEVRSISGTVLYRESRTDVVGDPQPAPRRDIPVDRHTPGLCVKTACGRAHETCASAKTWLTIGTCGAGRSVLRRGGQKVDIGTARLELCRGGGPAIAQLYTGNCCTT